MNLSCTSFLSRTRAGRLLSRLPFRWRLLGLVWLCFAFLVATRIHGSSIALSARLWAPKDWNQHFLAQPILDALGSKAGPYRSILMAEPREIRSDEFAIETLWAMAQFTHEPRFPVRNGNIGNGQNMLLVSWVPVAHPVSIVRPVTWGYLLFGPSAGLAWYWWFSPFFCFSTVFLALRIILRGHDFLSAFGALWFGSSAYLVCWSHFPAYTVGFAAMGMVAVHHLITTRTLRGALLAGLAAGYATAGFLLQMYPPWMVPLAYTFAAALVGLFVRDRLWKQIVPRNLAYGSGLAVVLAGVIVVAFFLAVQPELQALTNSAYPGQRRLNGGDLSLARLFGGLYNWHTIRLPMGENMNPSEWAGFILFLPTILFAVVLCRRVRRRLDAVGWAMLALGVAQVLYGELHIPQWLADVTLWSRVQAFRGQLTLGFVSIVLTLMMLVPEMRPKRIERRERIEIAVVVLGTAGFFLWVGVSLQSWEKIFGQAGFFSLPALLAPAGATLGALLLLLGRARAFAGLLIPGLLAIAGNFNPLSVSFSSIEDSDLRQAVKAVVDRDRREDRNSIWLASGSLQEPLLGTLVTAMGGRSLTGVFFHPQLSLWHQLDPEGRFQSVYNRYAEIFYLQLPLGYPSAAFLLSRGYTQGSFAVAVAPDNPLLLKMGVRHALTFERDVYTEAPLCELVQESADKRFRIWNLPGATSN
jgi:hypothetical protein